MASEKDETPSAPKNGRIIHAASSIDEHFLKPFPAGQDKQKMLLEANAGHFSMIRSAILTS
jgi:hypothetical protein